MGHICYLVDELGTFSIHSTVDTMRSIATLTALAGLIQLGSALHSDLHNELLLQGRPQVALWQALTKQEQADFRSDHEGYVQPRSDPNAAEIYLVRLPCQHLLSRNIKPTASSSLLAISTP